MKAQIELKKIVIERIAPVLELPEFKSWFAEEDNVTDGHVAVNNSVLFREDLKTRKNARFLCFPVTAKRTIRIDHACLASNISFNNKFVYLSSKDKKASLETLDSVLSSELKTFGRIPFILIGTIIDEVKIEAPLGSNLFDRVILDPTQKELVRLGPKSIMLRDLLDEEALWSGVEEAAFNAKITGPHLPEDLQQPFGRALSQLRADSYAVVALPDRRNGATAKGLMDDIISVLERQIREYSLSLAKCQNEPQNVEDFSNVLRISYNFSSDATKILKLLMNLCDLKPILCWFTIAEWFALSDSFQKLPWSKLTIKASLPAYQSMIGGARNKSFHNLFPFSKTLKVPLDGVPLEAISLTFFSEYAGRKNSNRFEYQDQALIEAFTEFSRAGEKFVPFSFWNKNLDVMSRTVDLLKATGDALRCLSSIA